ncbi:Necrosis inducing protein NPP1 [Phytophthora megakarya]|uniref:Necrosis inducing protein NPP1 n=1 Tax=Phytophthora megakarya TaxID=4795 RepID=A0A225VLS5_9STRA|nr:Necrosis inducing protein NPP1 [Phytophthora megakarya]
MNMRTFLFAAIASLIVVQAAVTSIDHDKVKPFTQPKPTTDSDQAAVKYKPLLTVSYGCQPYPAVQANGAVSAGLKGNGPIDGDCTNPPLGSQVYARSGRYKDKWAIMYAWYLPKGKPYRTQRRHFWETAVVWINDPASTNSTLLGVSVNYGHRSKTEAPVPAQFLSGSSVKLDQYKSFGLPKPKLRFTERTGQTYDLITWDQLTTEARTALSEAKFHDGLIESFSRKMPLKDGVFEKRLKDAWPF